MAWRSSSKKTTLSTRSSLVNSTPRLALEERQKNFISAPTDYNGTNRKKAVRVYHGDQNRPWELTVPKAAPLRWTWESPGGEYHNEIDHIIVKRRYCLTDIAVVPKFYNGSDHRLLRARFLFTRKGEKAAKFKKREKERKPRSSRSAKRRESREVQEAKSQAHHKLGAVHFSRQLLGNPVVDNIHDCARKIEGCTITRKRLSLETLELIRPIKTVLLYKKGYPHDIGNYRPICLLSVVYKLFTRVISNRIEKTLDDGQPCEQAGFRKGFSTTDHLHTVTKLIERSPEYEVPLCLMFIDLKKAFDSVGWKRSWKL